jgi:hypothetical protein
MPGKQVALQRSVWANGLSEAAVLTEDHNHVLDRRDGFGGVVCGVVCARSTTGNAAISARTSSVPSTDLPFGKQAR